MYTFFSNNHTLFSSKFPLITMRFVSISLITVGGCSAKVAGGFSHGKKGEEGPQ